MVGALLRPQPARRAGYWPAPPGRAHGRCGNGHTLQRWQRQRGKGLGPPGDKEMRCVSRPDYACLGAGAQSSENRTVFGPRRHPGRCLTAMVKALGRPARMTSVLPRVTPVWGGFPCAMVPRRAISGTTTAGYFPASGLVALCGVERRGNLPSVHQLGDWQRECAHAVLMAVILRHLARTNA